MLEPEPKQYRYELFGGPYSGGALVIEWDDITAFTDRTLQFHNHFGFYTIIGFCGYYGTQEHKIGEHSVWDDGAPGVFEREERRGHA